MADSWMSVRGIDCARILFDMAPPDADDSVALGTESFCYLTTSGRKTGKAHEIEIWFALDGSTAYMLSGASRSDWVRNLTKNPQVSIRIGGRTFSGNARVVSEPSEDERARELVWAKYQPSYKGDLTNWRKRSLPIAVDL
ncbi:MAG: nitroreductase family deazaflavin-dependent oxidoreductase [Acidimicrobiia bacterium]